MTLKEFIQLIYDADLVYVQDCQSGYKKLDVLSYIENENKTIHRIYFYTEDGKKEVRLDFERE